MIISITLVLLVAACYSQQRDSSKALTREQYLKKAKSRNTTGWVMLAGGAGFALLGAAMPSDELGPSSAGSFMILFGGTMMIASIPFFVSSGISRRKARTASANLKIEKTYNQKAGMITRAFPALSIKLNLR